MDDGYPYAAVDARRIERNRFPVPPDAQIHKGRAKLQIAHRDLVEDAVSDFALGHFGERQITAVAREKPDFSCAAIVMSLELGGYGRYTPSALSGLEQSANSASNCQRNRLPSDRVSLWLGAQGCGS